MNKAFSTLSWIIGGIFLIFGAVGAFQNILAGAAMVGMSLLVLPPVREAVYAKTGKPLSFGARTLGVLGLMMFAGFIIGQEEEAAHDALVAQEAIEKKAAQEAERLKVIEEFEQKREQIIAYAQSALDTGQFQEASAFTKEYLVSNDAALVALHKEANAGLRAREIALETAAIMKKISATDGSDSEKMSNLYAQLVKLNPNESE